MTTVQQIKELYKVIKQNGQATTAKCIVGANANIYTNLGINLSGTTAVPRPYSVMIGQNSLALGEHSIAIGRGVYAKGGCVAIGQYTTMTLTDDFKVIIGDGNASTSHNCFTSDGSVITIDNKRVDMGNNASVVNIGNKESIGINIGDGVNSWIYLGYATSSHTIIGEGNYSTVNIGNSGYSDVRIGEGAYNHVHLGNGVSSKTIIGSGRNSTVKIGDVENAQVSIGESNYSTVRIGNSFEGANIWNARNIFLNSPVSDVYVPIEFDYYGVASSSTSEFTARIPLRINNNSYTLNIIPKGTRYKIIVTSEAVGWEESQTNRLTRLRLGEHSDLGGIVEHEYDSDNNDDRNSRSVFYTTSTMVIAHDKLLLDIVSPTSVHTTNGYVVMITMYVPLSELALCLMQTDLN